MATYEQRRYAAHSLTMALSQDGEHALALRVILMFLRFELHNAKKARLTKKKKKLLAKYKVLCDDLAVRKFNQQMESL